MISGEQAILALIHSVGKLAIEEGEAWRLSHAELMDAYQACLEEIECCGSFHD